MANIVGAARANVLLAPLGACLALIATVVVARTFRPETYADYATIMALLGWLLLAAEGGCNVGLARYLSDASVLRCRLSLYNTLQWRRWCYVFCIALMLALFGPRWSDYSGLTVANWNLVTFLLVAILSGVMLHGQLASAALATGFHHKRLLSLTQLMTILRALSLASMAFIIQEPLALIGVLLLVACVEAFLLHCAARAAFSDEDHALPAGMATVAQSHGLVALFDKLSTAFGGGALLLLVLAGKYEREELALLAIATDLLQKVLGVSGLPITGLILPLLNESRADFRRFHSQLERLGGLVVCWFSIAVGGVVVILPVGLPLLVGEQYSNAVPIALVWVLPLFFESVIRMVWGSALLTMHQYRWLNMYNVMFSLVALAVVFIANNQSLLLLLAILGVVKMVMGGAVVVRAYQLGILPAASRPLGVLIAVVVCSMIALACQWRLADYSRWVCLLLGIGTYLSCLWVCLRLFPLVPLPAYDALSSLAGRHSFLLKLILATPSPRG